MTGIQAIITQGTTDRIVRVIDVLLAASLAVILAPIIAILCLVIWLHDGASPIFVHWRIGRGGESFPCLKLRTMVPDAERRLEELLETDPDAAREWALDQKLREDPRITSLGAFLRKSSLDELPQLFNVMVGQMSMVGPRPIVAAEVPRYGRYIRDYCRVRPGITGLWQVSGRNLLSYRRRVALDTLYSRNKSLAIDLLILTRTVHAVVARHGAT
ncbi:sugar transferase [Glacieibacterium sp.]|uniref:sugar transferase n=1 Tax=Glacieibacterium sp. TaxID=2860237 RepID=UPI003B007749